jgi:ParB family transcriptional regulator, chromosome partitioning protein
VAVREVIEIELDNLTIGKSQARTRDVDKGLDELAASIQKIGLLEPIVVVETDTAGKYEILTGQRRFLAHKKLGADSILAAILDERVDETQAKIISVTENLVRRDLNPRDTIDACTYLYKRYGSVRQVAEETGLSPRVVSQYVKYDRLVPGLQELVDDGEVKLATALRAQDAASVGGEVPDPEEAVTLAREMSSMSGAQAEKLKKARKEQPDKPLDDVIEHAKEGGKIQQIIVTLSSAAHESLQRFAGDEGTTQDDAAGQLIESGLSSRGYVEG